MKSLYYIRWFDVLLQTVCAASIPTSIFDTAQISCFVRYCIEQLFLLTFDRLSVGHKHVCGYARKQLELYENIVYWQFCSLFPSENTVTG